MESLLHSDKKVTDVKARLLRSFKKHESSVPVAIVDRRSYLREALAESLAGWLDTSVLAFTNVESVLATRGEIQPDINTIIFGVGAIGHELIVPQLRSLREAFSESCIVVLSDHHDDVTYDAFIRFEINGVIPISYSTEQLFACLLAIRAGVNFLPADTIENMLPENNEMSAAGKQMDPGLVTMLTPRQRQVLRYLAVGRSNKYIAAELNLCESTVKVHVSEIMRRLGATSRTHASYITSQMTTPFRLEPE